MKNFMHKILLEKPQNLVLETFEIVVGHVGLLAFCTKEVVNFSSTRFICPHMMMPTLSI
jgi:hypothetical protein